MLDVNEEWLRKLTEGLNSCHLCPRNCGVNRSVLPTGYCQLDAECHIAALVVHHGEEPVLSGKTGICNVFFSHCNLQCVYCQNHQISRNSTPSLGKITLQAAVDSIARFIDSGIMRLGFVSPSHQVPQMVAILNNLARRGYRPVVVYNSGGYDSVETLGQLEGLVDVYLPDYKYRDADLAKKWSGAQDYPWVAAAALREMYRQVGPVLHLDDDDMVTRGMIVRHLVLPGALDNSIAVVRFLADALSPKLALSLMSQYYPTSMVADHPQLERRLTRDEYEQVLKEVEKLGFSQVFVQELGSADCYQPDFSQKEPFCD